MSITRAQVEAFLADMTKVSHKHGMTIQGCGCCNSPFIMTCEKGTGEYQITPYPSAGPDIVWTGNDDLALLDIDDLS